MAKNKKKPAKAVSDEPGKRPSRKAFEEELEKRQAELCHLQSWVVKEGLRVVVVFEGRDAAGKRSARLNCISHLLSMIPYKKTKFELPPLPKRHKRGKDTPDKLTFTHTVPQAF